MTVLFKSKSTCTPEEAFRLVEAAAASGARCPKSGEKGLTSTATSALARDGKIKIEVFAHNWRVITILVGPHAGKSTAPPPNPAWRPYLTIGGAAALALVLLASAAPQPCPPYWQCNGPPETRHPRCAACYDDV